VTAFVLFGFAAQALLVGFFIAGLRHAGWQATAGALVYGAGVGAIVLALSLAVSGEPWYLILAPVLYAAWAGLGVWIDVIRPIPWRDPPRLSVMGPYVGLLIVASLAFWVPLWWVDQRLWLAFGVLYATHTVINLATHRSRGRPRAAR